MKPRDSRGGPMQSIREVFGYLRRYRSQIFVLKIDDVLLDLSLIHI